MMIHSNREEEYSEPPPEPEPNERDPPSGTEEDRDNKNPPKITTSAASTYNVILSVEQTDLITCLLLDQLVKLESTETELNPLMDSYAGFLLQVKSGDVIDSPFLEELESLKEVIKGEHKYVDIIDTLIALWNR